MKYTAFFTLIVASLVLISCSEDPSTTDPSNGSIQANSYVAIGNSVTAGVQSGAMYAEATECSFPNLIAKQIGADFVQPLMPGDGTGERIRLTSMNPVTLERGTLKISIPSNATYPAPYNNLGVPLALSYDLQDETALNQRANPVFQLILRDQDNFGKSVLAQALNLQPTFVTLWIGSNDILTYATSGGTTGTNATRDAPTDRTIFELLLTNAVQYVSQRAPNAKVVLGNIPEIATIPFFTTIPPMTLVDGNVVSLWVEDSQEGVRKATASDLVLLTAQTAIMENQTGYTQNNPLPDALVLDPHEQGIIAQAVSDFNAAIEKVATQFGYAVADIHGLYNDILAHGYGIAGETFTTAFISGGLFSLDGIHPTCKGSGVIANEFIRVMNAHYGANIRYVDISYLPGLKAPGTEAGTIAWSPDWKIPAGTFDGALKMVQK